MAQDFKIDWSPTNVLLGELFGYVSFNDTPISTLTFRHATNRERYDILGWSALTTVSFPNLVSLTNGAYISIAECPLLTTISIPVLVPPNGVNFTFEGNALTAASVNAILRRFAANSAYVSGTIDISGGTSAVPTGQGLTDMNTLTGRGVFVITN